MKERFSVFAALVLLYNIPVILWGAYVRVSFSGDGCGAHWPFCNGQVLPSSMTMPTIVEFTHRMMTSVDSAAVIALCLWAFWAFPKRHAVRRYAVFSLLFLFVEALLGAGLVLLKLVAKNQSAGRAVYLSAHLTNTLLLLGALTLTAWAAQKGREQISLSRLPARAWLALAVIAFVSVTGVIAALGDTLFPASSLAAGLHQDFTSPSAWVRLRFIHPLVALSGAAYLLWIAGRNAGQSQAARRVVTITVFQLAAGMINLGLLAPLFMQILHLLIADVLWIAAVVWSAEEMPREGALSSALHDDAIAVSAAR